MFWPPVQSLTWTARRRARSDKKEQAMSAKPKKITIDSEVVERCTCCDRVLNRKTLVYLELNWRTRQYSKESVPSEESQGYFAFGQSCAKKVLKIAAEATT